MRRALVGDPRTRRGHADRCFTAEQVMCHHADVRPLRFVAQHGCRDAELVVRLLGVAASTREFRFRESQLSQRIRPGGPFRAPLRLGTIRTGGSCRYDIGD